jgi:hypothetical protein
MSAAYETMLAYLLDETKHKKHAHFLAMKCVRDIAMDETFTAVRKDCESITITSSKLKKII